MKIKTAQEKRVMREVFALTATTFITLAIALLVIIAFGAVFCAMLKTNDPRLRETYAILAIIMSLAIAGLAPAIGKFIVLVCRGLAGTEVARATDSNK